MKEKKINIIAINRKKQKSYYWITQSFFSNNELVVMHGDRYRGGAKH